MVLPSSNHRPVFTNGSWVVSPGCSASFDMAYERRGEEAPILFRSDQGSQYLSGLFMERVDDHNIRQSMSRRGNNWDNAVAESFFAT